MTLSPTQPVQPSTRKARFASQAWARGIAALMVTLVSAGCTAKGQDAKVTVAAPAKPAPEPAAPAEALTLPLDVPGTSARMLRFELAEGIVEREPSGVATRFSKRRTPRVFAFLEVSNEGDKPIELGVAFEPVNSDEVSTMLTLEIPPSKRWRTQAFMNTIESGKFRAVIVNADDEELAVREFEVVP